MTSESLIACGSQLSKRSRFRFSSTSGFASPLHAATSRVISERPGRIRIFKTVSFSMSPNWKTLPSGAKSIAEGVSRQALDYELGRAFDSRLPGLSRGRNKDKKDQRANHVLEHEWFSAAPWWSAAQRGVDADAQQAARADFAAPSPRAGVSHTARRSAEYG